MSHYLISIVYIILGAVLMGLYPPNRVGIPIFIAGIVSLLFAVFGS